MIRGPLISVTLPNYNYGRFLKEAFESVLSQTYTNLEILFVDDGSTDQSREIARTFEKQDSRIEAVYFDKNQGALPAHANTWARVKGDLVYQFSSDDALVSDDFFMDAVQALDAYPHSPGIYGGAAIVSDETGEVLNKMGGGLEGFARNDEFIRGFLTGRYFVPGVSSIWRKKGIDSLGGYDYNLGPQTDYFINHALPAQHGIVFFKKLYAKARTSAKGQSFSSNTKILDEIKRLAMFEKKLRQITNPRGNFEKEWPVWRKMQGDCLIAKYGAEAVFAASRVPLSKA